MKRDNGLNVVNHPVLTRAIIRKAHARSVIQRAHIHTYAFEFDFALQYRYIEAKQDIPRVN